MRKLALALALTACAFTASAQSDDALVNILASNDAVALLYGANNAVQFAIVDDVCSDNGLEDVSTARDTLSDTDQRAYDSVRASLGAAYAQTNGTDGELEDMTAMFCEMISDR